jgi:hypothetical protein
MWVTKRAASSQSIEIRKANLLRDLSQVRSKLFAQAQRVGREGAEIAFVGFWSLLDLLAHLAGWDETNLRAADEIRSGNLPSFYAHHDKDWASYNAELVAAHRKATLPEMLAWVQITHQRLLAHLQAIPESDFFRDFGVRAGRYHLTIARLLEAEIRDERRHLEQVQTFLASLGKSPP